jgi:hypothetical protein
MDRSGGSAGRTQHDLDELSQTIDKCRALLPELSALMADRPGLGLQAGTVGRHAPRSTEPWADEAAHAYFTIYIGSKTLANEMRASLGMPSHPWPPGENGLEQVQAFAIIVDPTMLRYARKQASRWLTTALRIRDIDEAEVWTPVPRDPDSEPPFCPYCNTLSLRVNRRLGEVRCLFSGCQDADGNPTRARMEFDRRTGDGVLVFDDSTTITYHVLSVA